VVHGNLSPHWRRLTLAITSCQKCPRLRAYCREVGRTRRAAYLDQTYWTRPVAGFGDPDARIWIIGLAPGAHGANRTGRVFTGDRSGDFLYAALHRAGLANQPTSVSIDDGLRLRWVYVSAAARCAPPENKPAPEELQACFDFLREEWRLLSNKRVILALGKIGWDAAKKLILDRTCEKNATAFGHGAEARYECLTLVGSYHVSQQNTFTGKLTPAMFDSVIARCLRVSAGPAAEAASPRLVSPEI
jgi:uracil-DNA glycosylase